MNTIVRLVTVGIMLSALLFGFAGYTGARYGKVFLYQGMEDVADSGCAVLQEIRNLANYAADPEIVTPYCGQTCYSVPVASPTENMLPF